MDKLKKAIKKVETELINMSEKDFLKELNKYKNSNLAKGLEELFDFGDSCFLFPKITLTNYIQYLINLTKQSCTCSCSIKCNSCEAKNILNSIYLIMKKEYNKN